MQNNEVGKTKFFYIIIFVFHLLFISCSKNNIDSPVEPISKTRGQIISVTFGASYPVAILQNFFRDATVGTQSNLTSLYNVNAYKVVYATVDSKGNSIQASGALFIPEGKNNLSLMSFHHGTVTARSQAPSQHFSTNALEGLISASLGYFSLEPDYIGLGESTTLHPYLLEKSYAEAIIDFIRAGREYAKTNNITLNGQVLLAGYSEGGYATLAAQKEIEKNYRNEINITASAPMAGSYDMNLTARTVFQKTIYSQPGYIAFLFYAYNNIYGWNKLNDIFTSQYASKLPSLFDGSKSLDQINAALTTDLTKLLNKSFLDSFLNGTETQVSSALLENSLLDWTPAAPIKLFQGNADDEVPYQNSVEALNEFKAHGADVTLVTIEGGTHISSAVPSILGAFAWFESLRLNKVLALK
jgi:predicted esterase